MAMTPLGALIEHVRQEFYDREGTGLSYDAIARRGGAANPTSAGNRIHQLATQPIKRVPQVATLEVLANGLGVDVWYVTLLALDSAGYFIPAHERPAAPGARAAVVQFDRGSRKRAEVSDRPAKVPTAARSRRREREDPEQP